MSAYMLGSISLDSRSDLSPKSMTLFSHIVNVELERFVRIAIHEEPITMLSGHFSSCYRITTHEYWYGQYFLCFPLRCCFSSRLRERLWGEVELVILVEPAIEVEGTLRPDTAKTLYKFRRSFVSLVMLHFSSCFAERLTSSHGSPIDMNSCLNQPDTTLTAIRPLVYRLMPARVLAAIVGFHGPGRIAAMTCRLSVLPRMA